MIKTSNKRRKFECIFFNSIPLANTISEKGLGLADFQLFYSPLGQAVLFLHSQQFKGLYICIYTVNCNCWRSYTVAIFPSLQIFSSDFLTKRNKNWTFHPLYINITSNSRLKNFQINCIFHICAFFEGIKPWVSFLLNFIPHLIEKRLRKNF